MDSNLPPVEMSTEDAINKVLEDYKPITKYQLAKTLGVQPYMIDRYRGSCRNPALKSNMSDVVAAVFLYHFNIIVQPFKENYLRVVLKRIGK